MIQLVHTLTYWQGSCTLNQASASTDFHARRLQLGHLCQKGSQSLHGQACRTKMHAEHQKRKTNNQTGSSRQPKHDMGCVGSFGAVARFKILQSRPFHCRFQSEISVKDHKFIQFLQMLQSRSMIQPARVRVKQNVFSMTITKANQIAEHGPECLTAQAAQS